MPIGTSKVKSALGMQVSWYFPISEEPASGRPAYDPLVDMGAAVKGYLSVTTASGSIPGDDITQLETEVFVSGQIDVETTMSDLEVNAKIYGHSFAEETGEISKSSDISPNGGYCFIEPFVKKDKTKFYRATALLKVSAMASAEKQEADTKKSGEISFKNYVVSFKVLECNTGEWRIRKDFATFAEAESFLKTTFGVTPAAASAENPQTA